MAKAIPFAVYDAAGAPNPTATPTIHKYKHRDGTPGSNPTISNIGDGLFVFTPSDDDEALGIAYVVATGAFPAFYVGAVHGEFNPFAAVGVFDSVGALYTGGGVAVFISYQNTAGDNRTPPAIVSLETYLKVFTPSASDLSEGVAWIVQNPGAPPLPPNHYGFFDRTVQIVVPIISGPVDFGSLTSGLPGKGLPIGRDLEIDPDTNDLILAGGDLVLVKDVAGIRQEAEIRMGFFLGEWFLDQTQGVPYFQDIFVKAPNLTAIKTILTDAVLETQGISSLTSLELDYDRSARKLSVVWSALSDLNELIESEVIL